MKHILDAIMAGDTSAEDFAALELPESYRAVTVHKDEVDMFEGTPTKEKDPRKSLHVDDVPLPELGPGEAYVAVMASAINYNTVWTSIFEPVSTFGFLERYGRMSPAFQAARPAVPHRRLRPERRRAEDRRRRPQLEAGRPGRRALPLGGAGGPRRPQRHDARPRAAHLGVRDQLRRPRRGRAGQGQPADAEARAPDLGGGRLPWSGQLHRLPPAGQQERRRHEAGRQRPDLGRLRRPRRVRDAVRPQRRRHPDLRRLERGEGPDRPQHGRGADHQPRRGGLQVLEGRAHPGPEGVEALRQADP